MDPLTQGVLGAVASQQQAKPKFFVAASILGFLSGMAPDLDIFIRSSADPMLALEYHRHFTHSLIFIPIGSALCALFFFMLFARRVGMSFRQTYFYCFLGYATHGLLDACTSYGTQLLWPFSDMRVAWNTVSVIDPLFTLPLLLLSLLAVLRRQRTYAIIALMWVVFYAGFGVVQRERAEAFGLDIALSRGHQPVTLEVKPSFANLLVWKVVYRTETDFYVDAVRTGFSYRHYPGSHLPFLNIDASFPWLEKHSQQAKDIERFRWFSNGYIALSPFHPDRIIDIRYSLIPNDIKGLWGIELNQDAANDAHIRYVSDHERNADTFATLWKMIMGKDI